MRKHLNLLFVVISLFLLNACQMEASLIDLASDVPKNKLEKPSNTIAVAPSYQAHSSDVNGHYSVRSAVGEVTTGSSADANNQYHAEISISYQKL